MAEYVPDVLLWLFVVNLGIAFGAGLYEWRIVLPQWFERLPDRGIRVNAAAMLATDPGRRFWGFVTTLPLTLLTVANGVVAWQCDDGRRYWWVAAVAITLVERIGTFFYFIPTAIRLTRANHDMSGVAARWIAANYVRMALTLIGWLAALQALSLT